MQGTLVAFDKIQIFSEVSGILEETSRPFKEGSFFKKGDILARINEDEARYNLNAQKKCFGKCHYAIHARFEDRL